MESQGLTPIVKDADVAITASQEPDRVNIRVVAQDGGEVFFKIRKTTPFIKLTTAYCDRKGIDPKAVRFLFDGQRLSDDSTPEKMGMEDNDVIDALLQQTGGFLG